MRFYCFLLLVVLIPGVVRAQNQPAEAPPAAEAKRDKPSFIPFPIVFSQPETGLGYGLAVLPVFRLGTDTATRKSNARLIGWRTQKKQSLVQLTHSVFTPDERYFFAGEASFYNQFPINYYGFGPETRLADKSVIEYKVFIFNQRALKRLAPGLFAGLQYRLTDLRDVRVNEGIDDDPRRSRLFDRPAREYQQDTRISGVGPAVLYDARDNVLSTFRGNYLEMSALLNRGALGSDYRFSRYQFDGRHFRPLTKDNKTILALQVVGQFQGGYVPFRELANLGGANLLRGYYEGRYRDRQLLAAQAEVRRVLFGRFNGVVFGGVGQVGNTLADFDEGGLKVAGGAGLRFRFNRRDRLNVRLDYGVGSGKSSGVYFGIGEAF
ncbi:MAG TPA: BamA/TamA family outer membrane protein [Hymenobacter sp.]|jgi:outer membrane protein assembly factor BamA|uniref:BamA/TamA family outer membrane protein n=1 Tax=Hymenobacter sp. TaxID=1898978 RepID=UPI002ED7D578